MFHLLVILYAGDYHAAWKRIKSGQAGTWYGHSFMVESFTRLSEKPGHTVTVMTCQSAEPYEETLADGSRVVGLGLKTPEKQTDILLAKIEEQQPTHLLIRAPLHSIIKWATQQPNLQTIAVLTNYYSNNPVGASFSRTLSKRLQNWRTARRFNRPEIPWVLNHNVNASYSLQTIGVKPEKVIPFDWPQKWLDYPEKIYPQDRSATQPWTVFFVGSLFETKGVGDTIRAIAALRSRGLKVQFKLAGKGDLAHFQSLVVQLGVSDRVEFMGLIANTEVVPNMQAADIVIIPSRHEYPEGFPFTINEALYSRTPIIASNHFTFKGALVDRDSALIFPSGESDAIADAIQNLIEDPQLYEQLSHNSHRAWQDLQVPVLWQDFLDHWLSDQPEDHEWFRQHSLASGRYRDRLAHLDEV